MRLLFKQIVKMTSRQSTSPPVFQSCSNAVMQSTGHFVIEVVQGPVVFFGDHGNGKDSSSVLGDGHVIKVSTKPSIWSGFSIFNYFKPAKKKTTTPSWMQWILLRWRLLKKWKSVGCWFLHSLSCGTPTIVNAWVVTSSATAKSS